MERISSSFSTCPSPIFRSINGEKRKDPSSFFVICLPHWNVEQCWPFPQTCEVLSFWRKRFSHWHVHEKRFHRIDSIDGKTLKAKKIIRHWRRTMGPIRPLLLNESCPVECSSLSPRRRARNLSVCFLSVEKEREREDPPLGVDILPNGWVDPQLGERWIFRLSFQSNERREESSFTDRFHWNFLLDDERHSPFTPNVLSPDQFQLILFSFTSDQMDQSFFKKKKKRRVKSFSSLLMNILLKPMEVLWSGGDRRDWRERRSSLLTCWWGKIK